MLKKWMLVLLVMLLAGATGCNGRTEPTKDAVDTAIESFMETYAHTYVGLIDDEVVIDIYVLSGIALLQESGYDVDVQDFLTTAQVESYLAALDYSMATNAFKAMLVASIYQVDAPLALDALANYEDIDVWSYAYALIALAYSNNNPTLYQELLQKINVIREEDYRDADYAGVALMATYDAEIDKQPLFDLILGSLSEEGIVSWGEANASSTANVILGLIASGIDPKNIDYTTNDVTLIDALLQFEVNGAFKNYVNGEIDLLYATPQGFAALATYYIYRTDKNAISLFDRS